MRISISVKLLIYFFVFSVMGIVSIGTYSYQKARKAMISRTYNQLNSVRIEKENRLKVAFDVIIKDLNKLSEFEETKQVFNMMASDNKLDKDLYHHFIDAFFHNNAGYECITFYNNQDSTLSFPINKMDKNIHSDCKMAEYTYQQMFRTVKNGEIIVNDHYISTEDGQPKILIAKPIFWGQKTGLIILRIPIGFINNIMIDNNPMNGLGQTGESYLVGNDNLMRSSSRFTENSILSTSVNTPGVKQAFEGKAGTGIFKDYRGINVISSYSKLELPYLNWVILAEIDFEEAMIPIIQIRNNIVYLTLIISLLTLGIVAILSVALTQPIKALKRETEKIASGEFGEPIKMIRNDEFGDLIVAFNIMNTKLKEQSDNLEIERKLRITSMIDGQEMERQRLSRELHDSLGQQLLAIKIQLENAMEADEKKSKLIINNAIESFTATTREIRNLSNNLMPAVLSEFGLITALNNLIRDIKTNFNIQITLKTNIEDKYLSVRQETYLYRICQEAANNMAKYSQATLANINIQKTDNNLIINIIDNGNGFVVNKQTLSKGNGLSNMKERTLLLSGQFKLEAAPNKGTKIQVIIPLNQQI